MFGSWVLEGSGRRGLGRGKLLFESFEKIRKGLRVFIPTDQNLFSGKIGNFFSREKIGNFFSGKNKKLFSRYNRKPFSKKMRNFFR
jgi:hypothetical protein